MDVREGYCGHCHDWTDGRRQVEDPFNRNENRRGLRVHARPIDVANARQMTFIGTESTAVHSRSKGWLPMVAMTLTHVPLVDADGPGETVMLMLGQSDVELIIDSLRGGIEAAVRDAAAGPIEGP